MGDAGVGDHHLGAPRSLLEKVVEALAFEPAQEEVVVGLVVLADVLPALVLLLEAKLEVRGLQAAVPQQLRQELGRALVQKDLVVLGEGQPPELGGQHGAVEDVAADLLPLLEELEDAGKGHIPLGADHGESGRALQDLGEVQVLALGDQLDVELVEGVEPFAPGKADHAEGVAGLGHGVEPELLFGKNGHAATSRNAVCPEAAAPDGPMPLPRAQPCQRHGFLSTAERLLA